MRAGAGGRARIVALATLACAVLPAGCVLLAVGAAASTTPTRAPASTKRPTPGRSSSSPLVHVSVQPGGSPIVVVSVPGLQVTLGGSAHPSSRSSDRSSVTPTPSSSRVTAPSQAGQPTHRRRRHPRAARPSTTAATERIDAVQAPPNTPAESTARTPGRVRTSAPAQAALVPPPGTYATLRNSFPYLLAVASGAGVLVFGFVLVVAALARRREPVPVVARKSGSRPQPRPQPPRRRRTDEWHYTFDASPDPDSTKRR